jgi:hypothetical protein
MILEEGIVDYNKRGRPLERLGGVEGASSSSELAR